MPGLQALQPVAVLPSAGANSAASLPVSLSSLSSSLISHAANWHGAVSVVDVVELEDVALAVGVQSIGYELHVGMVYGASRCMVEQTCGISSRTWPKAKPEHG